MSELENAATGFSKSLPTSSPAPTGSDAVQNFYRILNITQDASRMEIRDAYMRLKSAYSSDNQALYSLFDENETKKTIELIDQAYLTLEDDKAREDYDRKLKTAMASSARKKQLQQQEAKTSAAASLHNQDLFAAEFQAATRERSSEVQSSTPPTPVIRATAQRSSDSEVQQTLTTILVDADTGDGDLLRKLREACGVSVEELQERTKILADYIRGIEENRFDRLPPAVYVRGFIRSFLKYLSVANPDRYAKAYADRLELWKNTTKS